MNDFTQRDEQRTNNEIMNKLWEFCRPVQLNDDFQMHLRFQRELKFTDTRNENPYKQVEMYKGNSIGGDVSEKKWIVNVTLECSLHIVLKFYKPL